MGTNRSLGLQFKWLWIAYGASTLGTWVGFGAFSVVAITVLHSQALAVSLLGAGGLAAGAIVAIPAGPWIEFREKRGVMIALDLIRFLALLSIPIAYWLDTLSFMQLLLVSIIAASANITFNAASGAYLKTIVGREHLLIANSRLESTLWTATIVGPPLGGTVMGLFGPVITIAADAVSYLVSAFGIGAIKGQDQPSPERVDGPRRMSDLLHGWRYIINDPQLRRLFFNTVLVNALIMVSAPLMAVLMLGSLEFAPWEYGLVFGLPCIGGLLGSRLAGPLVSSLGQNNALVLTGTLRVLWPVGLAFVSSGTPGFVLVIAIQFLLVTFCGAFNPIFATYRLQQIDATCAAQTFSAWSITAT